MNACHRIHVRCGYTFVLAIAVVTFSACTGPRATKDPAAMHARSATGDQQELWQRHAGSANLARLQAGTGEVTAARVLEVDSSPTAQVEERLPPQVATQVLMESVPDQALGDKPLVTRGRVVNVQAERLTIEAPEGMVQLQIRVGGRTLALREGEEVDIEIRTGSPFRRSDYLQVKGEKDALGYALVGGEGPVTIELPLFNLTARQEDPRADRNTMGVTVRVGEESQRIDELGDTLRFEAAGLFVRVLASIAADEKTAALLPEPHRLEIIVWPISN